MGGFYQLPYKAPTFRHGDIRREILLQSWTACGITRQMGYRTIEICWLPRSKGEWQTFTQARQEAARLWRDLVVRHARLRRLNWSWPSKGRWEKWAKGLYPNLHSQTVQQIIGEFVEAVNATRQLRKHGQVVARYPWKTPRYRDLPYTNQAARLSGGAIHLPNGKAGKLRVRLPIGLPGRIMEVRLCYGKVLIVCEIPAVTHSAQTTTGNDLGVNTLIAATDGIKAILVSGKEAKATVQWRNKLLASLQTAQAPKLKHSRRWKRLQRRKYKLLDKARRRLRDLTHKATTIVQHEFPDAQAFVGEPFNEAAQHIGRKQAQQVSSACNRKIIDLLTYKGVGAIVVPEPYSSQTCPVCGCRQKCRRIYRCRQCGYTAPRDVVGATNILRLGKHGSLSPSPIVPTQIKYRRPVQTGLRSSGGHPASSSSNTSSPRSPCP